VISATPVAKISPAPFEGLLFFRAFIGRHSAQSRIDRDEHAAANRTDEFFSVEFEQLPLFNPVDR
jgi:hypothetical protein